MVQSDFQFPLQPHIPLVKDVALVVQNIIQLFLTNPLEHIYYPSMGVGLEGYLFETGSDLFSTLQQPISEQIKKYVPDFELTALNIKQENNGLNVSVMGKVLRFGAEQVAFEFNI